MPMTALLEGRVLSAAELSTAEWEAVRGSYQHARLTMTCGERAIPKQSSLGLRFFAHHPGADCQLHDTGPETAEHHEAKATLARVAAELGWQVHIEYVSPDRTWIADVLLTRGNTRIALEVQWTAQSEHEFARRTRRYEEAGVLCFWFLGPANHTRVVPRSYAIHGSAKAMRISMPGAYLADPDSLPLEDGARRLMAGELNSNLQVRVTHVDVTYFLRRCFRDTCNAWMSRWFASGVQLRSRCGSQARIELCGTSYVEFTTSAGHEIVRPGGGLAAGPWWAAFALERVETELQQRMAAAFRQEGLPAVTPYAFKRTREVPEGYVAAMCPECSVTQGDSHLWREDPRPRELTIPWGGPFPLDLSAIAEEHWCLDIGDGRCAPTAPQAGAAFPGPHQLWSATVGERAANGWR